jgi:hypothetical protein
MAQTITEHNLFVASPGDTAADRQQMGNLLAEINNNFAPDGHRLRLVRWETEARPDGGRPQAVINEQIPDYDIFIAVLWTRLGTPTGGFGSGTEEEIALALKRREADPSAPVFIYFCNRPFWPASKADVEQLQRLFEFRERLEREQRSLHWNYGGEAEFRDVLRNHLCKRLREVAAPPQKAHRRERPDMATVDALHALWPSLAPDAQEAFSIAYNENRAVGDPGLATHHLFAALHRIAKQDRNPLGAMLDKRIEAAMPDAVQGHVVTDHHIATEHPWLSHCVAASVKRLLRTAPPGRKINAADIFADIAKHGTGESVRKLREHGIMPADIDAAVARAGISVVVASPD